MTNAKAKKASKSAAETEPKPATVSQLPIDPRSDAKPPRPTTKIGTVIALLTRDEGATLDEIVDATGWQKHSARAALTGLKKKGHAIVKSKRGDVTCYHIEGQA